MVKSPFNKFLTAKFSGKLIFLGSILFVTHSGLCQRVYKANSVLKTGNWFQIAAEGEGIYKMDVPFLNKLGLSSGAFTSTALQLFGNGAGTLSESNADPRVDDLEEVPLWVEDGGDGMIDGTDYVLFYSQGPHQWLKDSANNRFKHRKNLYSDRAIYFLTIGSSGKRISISQENFTPNLTITSFNDRYFHELDTFNFLTSGKEWFGEEFANAPGKSLSRNFSIVVPTLQLNQPVTIHSDCIARSVGTPSRFDVQINGQLLQQLTIPAVSGGQYDLFAHEVQQASAGLVTQNELTINFLYQPGSFNSQGWLNWFEVFCRRDLSMEGVNQLFFRDWLSVGNNIGEFIVKGASQDVQVWEVTDPLRPVVMRGNIQNNEYRFANNCNRLREYIGFNRQNFLIPVAIGKIANQDLHQTQPVDYLIVTYPEFLSEATRLAEFHRKREQLRVVVVTTNQVFNEFSSGIPDPVAIRDFVKMYYDKTGGSPADRPKYLLLFGDASFDYKDRIRNNTNLVASYQSNSSLDPLSTYTSDDFFGFLDDNEDINSGTVTNQLDIGIGRIPARNMDEAKNYVDKVDAYFSKESFGPWRNNLMFIADDEDFNLHLQDAEIVTNTASQTNSIFNQQKIYLDAYLQESGSGGSRYPQVNEAINNQVYNGTLIWDYIGHGGSRRLAEEVILDQDIVNNWANPHRLPLFITATCDFAPFDNPLVNSLGENILLRPKTGGIGLMTTTRVVFAFSNRILNNNYLKFALEPDASGRFRSLGEAAKQAKNYTYQTSGDIVNNRKFTFLGDPALTLGYPQLKIRATKLNGQPISSSPDTLKSTDKVTLEGDVIDALGNPVNDFNGVLYSIVFDKIQTRSTLANDPTSQPASFQSQTNTLFKGKASVNSGKFSVSFKVPKDINYQFGKGKISFYAEDGKKDGNGSFTDFIIGGVGINSSSDHKGPDINVYLNDETFVNGGISNETPVLIVKLADSSGINTVGTGIGHDIVATLDDDPQKFFVLNDFYESVLNDYQNGVIHFQLPVIEPGNHSLRIKAWDVMNNSNEYFIDFIVVKDEELAISHVLNYPNPFTTRTQFWFEHNKPGQDLRVHLQIFTLSGRVIKSFRKTINTPGNRSSEVEWDGRDEYGTKIGRGVYLYKLVVTDQNNKKIEKIEKLVIF